MDELLIKPSAYVIRPTCTCVPLRKEIPNCPATHYTMDLQVKHRMKMTIIDALRELSADVLHSTVT